MSDRPKMQKLLPLMREYGGLERKRLGEGVTPLEYQRWLDLKGQIGGSIEKRDAPSSDPIERRRSERRRTRMLAVFESRNALRDAMVTNISAGGLFLATPFAAEVGTSLIVSVRLERSGETVDIPCTVVTSIGQGAHTLATIEMGMGLKFDRLSEAQAAVVSEIFEGALDDKLKLKPKS